MKAADAPLPKAKRSRSTETGLAPNQHYSGGKTGKGKPRYEYVTDDKGRIRGAYGDLKLKPEGQKPAATTPNQPAKSPEMTLAICSLTASTALAGCVPRQEHGRDFSV